jgi:hypothetical protein
LCLEQHSAGGVFNLERVTILLDIGILTLLFVIPVSPLPGGETSAIENSVLGLGRIWPAEMAYASSCLPPGTGAFLLGRILAWLAHGPGTH